MCRPFLYTYESWLFHNKKKPNKMNKKGTTHNTFARKDNGVSVKWMLTVYLSKKRENGNLTKPKMFH
jgi:hypothetical protein